MFKQPFKANLLYFTLSICLIILLALAGFNLNFYLTNDRVSKESAPFDKEKAFWEKIVKENPTYRDGWIQLAKIANKLGDKDYATGALNTAGAIDPYSNEIKTLKEELGLFGL